MKASLLVLQPEKAPATFNITSSQATVGRAAGEDIRIDDAAVSDRHATISITGESIILEDAGSSNGTYVNGLRIARAELKNADRLRFGLIEAVLQCESITAPDSGAGRLESALAELEAARREAEAQEKTHAGALGKISELERQIALITKNREALHAQNLKAIGELAQQHAATAKLAEEANRANLEVEQLAMQLAEAKAQQEASGRERAAAQTAVARLEKDLSAVQKQNTELLTEGKAARKYRAEAEAKNSEAQTLIQSFARERDAAFTSRDEMTRELAAVTGELKTAQAESQKVTSEREQLARDFEAAKAAEAKATAERESWQQKHDLIAAEAAQAQNHVKSVLMAVDAVHLKNQELISQIESLRDSNASLNGEIGRASGEIEILTRDRLEEQQRSANLTGEIARHLADLQKSQAENFELQAALAEMSARLAQAESDADFFARERDTTCAELQRASSARDQWQAALNTQNALAGQLALARTSIEQVQAGMQAAAQEVERLQAEAELPKPPRPLGREALRAGAQEKGDAVQNTLSWINRGLAGDAGQPREAEAGAVSAS